MVYRTMLPLFLFSFVFPLVVLFFGFVFSVRILWSLSLFVSVPVSVCLLLSLSLSLLVSALKGGWPLKSRLRRELLLRLWLSVMAVTMLLRCCLEFARGCWSFEGDSMALLLCFTLPPGSSPCFYFLLSFSL